MGIKRLTLLRHLADEATMALSLPSERGDNTDTGWCELILTTSNYQS